MCFNADRFCSNIRLIILISIIADESLQIPLEKRLAFAIVMNESFLETERESLVAVLEFAKNK